MKSIVVAIILFLFPSWMAFPVVKLIGRGKYIFGRGSRIGFSLILTKNILLGENSRIGHANLIIVATVKLEKDARIKKFNRLKGYFRIHMQERAVINQFNKIVCGLSNIRESELRLGYNAIVGVSHLIDMTSNILIGDNSILAGSGSQLWTHSFYHSKQGTKRWRVDGQILIGANVYIGTRCIICAGVNICDATTLGAGCIAAKSIDKPGLYVGQALRFIEFDPDEAIKRHRRISDHIYEK